LIKDEAGIFPGIIPLCDGNAYDPGIALCLSAGFAVVFIVWNLVYV